MNINSTNDKEVEKLEKKLKAVYLRAQTETQAKMEDYLQRFAIKDAIKQEQVKQGKIKQKDYINWRKGQIAVGKLWQDKVNALAADYTNANQIAVGMIRNQMSGTFATNHNYAAYQLEHDVELDLSFSLYDQNTLKNLVMNDPNMLPLPSVNIPKDERWNRQKINSVITQAILQGDSIPEIAKSLRKVATMNYKSAVRNARTSMTAAQNAGRVESYKHARDMGIDLEQEWLATLDGRTRHSHRQMDGEKIAVAKDKWHPAKFSNGCRYPGDPQGPPWEIYNCRCTLVAAIKGIDQSNAPRNSKLGDMSYEEWKANHKKKTPVEPIKPTTPAKPREPERKLVGNVREQLGDGFVDAMETMLNFAEGKEAENVASVYYKFGKRLKVTDANEKDGAYFSPFDRGVHLHKNTIVTGDSCHVPFQTAFHEFAHNIDFIAGDEQGGGWFTQEYKNGLLEKTLAEDFNNFIKQELKNRGGSIASRTDLIQILKAMNPDNDNRELWAYARNLENYAVNPEDTWGQLNKKLIPFITNNPKHLKQAGRWVSTALRREGLPLSQIGSMSDAIEGQGAPSLGVGHGGTYWRKVVPTTVDPSGYQSTHKQPLEFFAEYCDGTIANPKSLKQMRRVFPKSCDLCAEIVEEMLKL